MAEIKHPLDDGGDDIAVASLYFRFNPEYHSGTANNDGMYYRHCFLFCRPGYRVFGAVVWISSDYNRYDTGRIDIRYRFLAITPRYLERTIYLLFTFKDKSFFIR